MSAIAGSCADPDAPDAAKDSRVESSYGDGPDRFGVLHLPSRPGEQPLPTVVLVHGGFWSSRFTLDLMDPLVADLVGRGGR